MGDCVLVKILGKVLVTKRCRALLSGRFYHRNLLNIPTYLASISCR